MNELHLFAGGGGGILAGQMLGHRCIGAVEIDTYARRVLVQRQRDRALGYFPIFDDIRTFDAKPFLGHADVVCGGFPCQDISSAGLGRGLEKGPKSSLWFEMLRVVGECRPRYVFIENSTMLRTRGLDVVLEGLASLGFDAEWDNLSAADVGAPHIRDRLWILAANPNHARQSAEPFDAEVAGASKPRQAAADAHRAGRAQQRKPQPAAPARQGAERGGWWATEPPVGRVVDGMADRVGQLRLLGNGQVPLVAATAFEYLKRRLEDR